MADKNTLTKMSQDVLVIPLGEEEVEIFDRFCEKQVEEMTQDRLETFILSFLNRENNENLMEAFEKFCKDDDCGEGLSREAIVPMLSEYIVLKTIENMEANEERALYSLLLKNALILAVKGNGFVAYPKAISDTFSLYHDYIVNEKTFVTEDEGDKLTRGILDSEDDSLAETICKAEKGVIKSIVYDAAAYRYQKVVDVLKVESTNLVRDIYRVAKQLVEETPWFYIDQAPADNIKKILGEDYDAEITLSNVIENLRGEEEGEDHLLTSILLRIIGGDVAGIDLSGETRFKAVELAIYLYYELLAEAISEEIKKTKQKK